MANGIRTGDPRGFSKGRSLKFRVGSRVRQTPEEGWRTYRPKCCGNNNKDEDNSPKTLNDKNLKKTPKKFYWERGKEMINIEGALMIEELKSFWSNICSHEKSDNKKARFIGNIKDNYENNEPQMYEDIILEKIINTLKRTHKWKSPRID